MNQAVVLKGLFTTEFSSPEQSILWLGPLPIRAYALCILLGVAIAMMLTSRRLEVRGHSKDDLYAIVIWAVPFGIIGGRLYHVLSTPRPYFGADGNPLDALKIWQGGLGIWGAVALGAVGAAIGAKKVGVPFLVFADAAAPGVAFAQAIGRFGNYFNNELYGGPTDLPWAVKIYSFDQAAGQALLQDGKPVVLGTFHPTFLYEALWCVLIGFLLLKFSDSLRHRGQIFAAYIAAYPLGRVFIETMRTDYAEIVFGLRINVWVSLAILLLGVVLWWRFRRNPLDRPLPEAKTSAEPEPAKAEPTR